MFEIKVVGCLVEIYFLLTYVNFCYRPITSLFKMMKCNFKLK
jgi:hypothetical protein